VTRGTACRQPAPFFGTGRLAEPTTIGRGDRVAHLVYDVSR
jgi:hypothetical protein